MRNMDNKFIKNQRKVASSSYPPRNLSDEMGFEKLVFMRVTSKFA